MMKEERLHGEDFRAFLEEHLDFDRWGFKISYYEYSERFRRTNVIYDSPLCRIEFRLNNIGHFPDEDELHVMYGRHHALNNRLRMTYEGEECYCWHYSIRYPVQFLEGISPQAIISHRDKVGGTPLPLVLAELRQTDTIQKLRKTYPPEAVVRREALIWEHYGERFFQLFDLHRPDLWQDYRHYVEEIYWLKPPVPVKGDPSLPRYKIC